MSDELIGFFDFKRDRNRKGGLQFGGMLLNPPTLNDIILRSFMIPRGYFLEVSDTIYDMLNGRVWMGHDIEKVDTPLLEAEFKKINKPAPTALSKIDTLHFTSSDTALGKIAIQVGLGRQAYGSCKDCRKNLKAIKKCEAFMAIVGEPEIKYEVDVHPMLSIIKYHHDEAENARRLSGLALE
uniref:Protein NEN3 n=1 Tax=Noccaea caerulescens TaxID=107243 RepID=A0A1J3D3S4_NOCCA